MTDRYANFAHSGAGRFFVRRLGLPEPPKLRRYEPGTEIGPIALGGAGRLVEPARKILDRLGAAEESDRNAALIFDATGIADTQGLRALYDFFHPIIRSLRPSCRGFFVVSPP